MHAALPHAARRGCQGSLGHRGRRACRCGGDTTHAPDPRGSVCVRAQRVAAQIHDGEHRPLWNGRSLTKWTSPPRWLSAAGPSAPAPSPAATAAVLLDREPSLSKKALYIRTNAQLLFAKEALARRRRYVTPSGGVQPDRDDVAVVGERDARHACARSQFERHARDYKDIGRLAAGSPCCGEPVPRPSLKGGPCCCCNMLRLLQKDQFILHARVQPRSRGEQS